jgi:hypothetical protein
MVFGAVQMLLPMLTQHGCERPPQAPHDPDAQIAAGATPAAPQSAPAPTQR